MPRSKAKARTGAILTIVAGALAIAGLFGWSEYSNWKSRVASVEMELTQTARGVAQHTDDLIEMSRLPLASLTAAVLADPQDPRLAARLKALIALQMKASPSLDTLSFIDTDGRIVATSVDNPSPDLNFADREYFRFHVVVQDNYPVVGKPIKSRLSGEWGIPISQRVTLTDGAFGGIVLSMIPLRHFMPILPLTREMRESLMKSRHSTARSVRVTQTMPTQTMTR